MLISLSSGTPSELVSLTFLCFLVSIACLSFILKPVNTVNPVIHLLYHQSIQFKIAK